MAIPLQAPDPHGADLGDVSSSFAMEEIKCTTRLPLDYAGS